MRRGSLLTVFATVVVAGALVAGSALATVITVPGDYPTIQSAVDVANTSDIILVSPGVYNENVVIDVTELQLIGSGPDVTTIYPVVSDVGPAGPPVYGNSQIVVVAATDVQIQGFTIDGDSPTLPGGLGTLDARNGIVLNHTTGNWGSLRMQDLVIQNCYMMGAYLRGASLAPNLLVTTVICRNMDSVPFQSAGIALYNATGTVTANNVSFCELGIAYLSGSGGHVHGNTVSDNTIGILVSGNGSAVEVGDLNNVINYESAGIEASQAGASVDVHGNLVSTTAAPGPGGSGGIAIFGQAVTWTGYHQINGNTISGPAQAVGSYGVWIDTFAGSTMDVHAELKNNDIHFFDIGVYIVDSNSDPSADHDVVVSADSTLPNRLSSNGGYAVMLDACDDNILATWNDWGEYTPGDIEREIWHLVDDASLGQVFFQPWYQGTIATEPATWGDVKSQFK